MKTNSIKNLKQGTIQLAYIVNVTKARCYWCGQQLRQCGMCKASGKFRNETCTACLGNGWMCPTHEGDWLQE